MLLDCAEFFSSNTGIKFYPNAIPITEESEVGTVRIMPSFRASRGGLATMELQAIIRASHPETAEQIGKDLINKIDKKTSFYIGSTRVVLLEVKNPFPIYVGKDENDRYKFAVDSWILIEK